MILKKVLASYTFRFMSGYVAGLSVSVFFVLAIVYATFSYDFFQQVSRSVSSELDDLERIYRNGGATAVDAYIADRAQRRDFSRFFYLVVDHKQARIAGNLDGWPQVRQYAEGWWGIDSEGWLSFELDVFDWLGHEVDAEFVAKSLRLESGEQLLVARHYEDVIESGKLVGGALFRSMLWTIALGTLGGAIVAGLSVKRIDGINRSLERIMRGDLSERVPSTNMQGDYRDLTLNLNRMLDRIQTLMEGVRQVSDNIAHDLRTPLTRLRNHLSQLQGKVLPGNEEAVQQVVDEADGLLSTFNALLRIAQVESGNRRAGFTALDLKVILLDVLELYEPLAHDSDIVLTAELADDCQLVGDRDLLFQAFANVVDNAIKYTPAGGRIVISLSSERRQATVTIADSGIGIPQEDKSKVFRRFFRVESSRSEQPGNGLGLSLVYAVVKLHHGAIIILDNHPGARVEVTLPLRDGN